MKSMAEINAEREPSIKAAINELGLSGRKGKVVRSTLMGHHGERIIRDHSGDVAAAARSVAGLPSKTPVALRANLAARGGRDYTVTQAALDQRKAASARAAEARPQGRAWKTIKVPAELADRIEAVRVVAGDDAAWRVIERALR